MWSGYITVPTTNGSANVHYWLVENAAADPQAPIVVWQQVGHIGLTLQGCSTLYYPKLIFLTSAC